MSVDRFRAKRAAASLSTVSGVECAGFFPEGRSFEAEADEEEEQGTCVICDAYLAGHPAPPRLDRTHRFALYQAEQLADSYIYLCPYTLLHIAAPVLSGDQKVGVLISGPAVLGRPGRDIIAALGASKPARLLPRQSVEAWTGHLPQIGPQEATSLSEILFSVALSLSDRQGAELMQQRSTEPGLSATDLSKYAFHLSSMEGDKHSSMRYPVEQERELMDLVSGGDKKGARRVLRSLLEAVFAPGAGEEEEIRSRVLELVVLLSRAAIIGGADVEQIFGLEYRYLSRLKSLKTPTEITRWLTGILDRFMDLVFDLRNLRYSEHLSRALRHIYGNYRDSISLEQTARKIGLSPAYLSRIFNGQLNTTFSGYINSVRIQEARRLLQRTNDSVGDIGYRCGFSEHSYFTQVFRRHTGMAPSEFRRRNCHSRD